jgi:hypothetical protein
MTEKDSNVVSECLLPFLCVVCQQSDSKDLIWYLSFWYLLVTAQTGINFPPTSSPFPSILRGLGVPLDRTIAISLILHKCNTQQW